MLPAKQMFDKIKWSEEYLEQTKYELGFHDRRSPDLYFVRFTACRTQANNSFSFLAKVTYNDNPVHIPYHRLRVIKYNNEIIWQRPTL